MAGEEEFDCCGGSEDELLDCALRSNGEIDLSNNSHPNLSLVRRVTEALRDRQRQRCACVVSKWLKLQPEDD